jgi:hypothetical protein
MSALALIVAAASMLLSASLYAKIQDERERNIRDGCLATNERNDAAIMRLDELIAEAPPERRARAEAGRAGTVLLIEALVPKRDCDAYVAEQVRRPP